MAAHARVYTGARTRDIGARAGAYGDTGACGDGSSSVVFAVGSVGSVGGVGGVGGVGRGILTIYSNLHLDHNEGKRDSQQCHVAFHFQSHSLICDDNIATSKNHKGLIYL